MSSSDGGRVRVSGTRRTRGLVATLLMVMLSLLLGPSSALAFTPADILVASTSSVTVDVRHNQIAEGTTTRDPKQGERFTYTMDFTLAGMGSPDVTRTTTITVYADPNAPFTSTPTAADFSGMSGVTFTPATGSCNQTSCTFTLTGVSDGTLRFTKTATVNADLGPGTLIMASANAEVTPQGKATIQNLQGTPLIGTCSGAYNFKQQVVDGGAWLVDMKFGDELGNGKVFLS